MSLRNHPAAEDRLRELLGYNGPVVNVLRLRRTESAPVGGMGNWFGPSEPGVQLNGEHWEIVSFEYLNVTPLIGGAPGLVRVDALLKVDRKGIHKGVVLHFEVRPDGKRYEYVADWARKGMWPPQAMRFNSAARKWFADAKPPPIAEELLQFEGDDGPFFDAIMRLLGVYQSRDEKTWSFRPSFGRPSGR